MQAELALTLPATPAESRRARDRGLKLVRSANAAWLDDAEQGLRQFATGRTELTIEAFRHWRNEQGGAQPTSHHAWGALAQRAVRAGLLKFDRYEKARSVKTHAHPIAVYRVAGQGASHA